MKKLSILLLLLLISLSCSRQDPIKIHNHKQTKDYRISIYPVDVKMNEKGEAQCSKYTETKMDKNSYYSYGQNLLSMLVALNHSSRKYIENLPPACLRKLYFKVEIKNLTSDELDYDTILQPFLLECFQLSLEKKMKTVDGYALTIVNQARLNTFVHKDSLQQLSVTIQDDRLKTNGIQLYNLAGIYDEHVVDYIAFSGKDSAFYAFELPILKDIAKANRYLYTYGLQLQKTQLVKEFYTIKPKAGSGMEAGDVSLEFEHRN